MASKNRPIRTHITNRSPYQVLVRADATKSRQFSFADRSLAEEYQRALEDSGLKTRLSQLETSFQLRLRRKGIKQQTLTFDTFAQAEQALLKMESDLSVSIVRDYAVAARTSLRELMERYLDEVVPTHKGEDVERVRIRRMLREEAFVDKKLAALSTEDLQDFIQDRLTEVRPSTVDRELDLVAQTLNYSADVWKIASPDNPLKGLRRPKYFNERDRRLSEDEEERLLGAARDDENPFVEAAIILALETAMRRGEVLRLTGADVNFERRFMLARDTKNGRDRKVPMSARAAQVVRNLMAAQSDEGADHGRPLLDLTANALKKAFFNRVIPASGVADLHFHDLRHESISRLAESGRFQLIDLQAISGHRDMRMLQRYTHLCSTVLAEKMDQISLTSTREYIHRGRKRKVVTTELVQGATSALADTAPKKRVVGQGPTLIEPQPCSLRKGDNVVDFQVALKARRR